ncbi:hypothetical protein D7V95_05090 [bacterium J10(2018)]|uniref:hypothetical protein n=1 Tax=Muribaculum intestinale TaxID=1796646 RepID=UPI000EF56141|nr:hypothetical protein [Muribaculum intestinale]RLT77099.1 hypothetical protein D7V95_05090 [bacterium J10(2018)]
MEKFEDILVNYFGATQPIFDNTTGGLTLSGEKAYKKLKALINKLGAVKVLDKNNVLEALKKIVETHILISQFNLSSELNGLRLAVIGKTLFTYDSWNGSSMTIVVDGIEILTDSVLFTGKNNWGNRSGIYVGKEYLEELIATGAAVQHNTIDHCDVTTSWTLKNHSKN